MNTIDHSGLLLQMRALAARAQGSGELSPVTAPAARGVDFGNALKTALDGVNASQQTAKALSERFEKGDPKVDLSQVMISMQKANVSFQAVTQVRNKLVGAYQDIMNMPI